MIKNLYRFLLIILLIVVFFCFFYFRLYQYFKFSFLQTQKENLENFYLQNPFKTAIAYFLLYVFIAGLSLPGVTILTIAGGFLFGILKGTILVSFASTTGALIAFLCARFLLKNFVNQADLKNQTLLKYIPLGIKKHKVRFKKIKKKILEKVKEEGAWYLLTLRLIPVFPFFLVNLVMGITSMKPRVFFLISQIGMLPATLLYVNAGDQLSRLKNPENIMSLTFIVSLSLLGVFPLLVKKLFPKNR